MTEGPPLRGPSSLKAGAPSNSGLQDWASEPPVTVTGTVGSLTVIEGGWDQSPLWDGFSRFVPRLSWKDGHLLKELPAERDSAIAKALHQAGGDAQMVLRAHAGDGHRVVLDPEAWRNQQPPKARVAGFRALGPSLSLGSVLDPAALRTTSLSSLVRYAEAFFNAQLARHADALVTPCHLAGGPGSGPRDGELRLAHTAASLARREHIAERSGGAKPLLAGIAVEAAALRNLESAIQLARSYATLEVDGFWVRFAGLTEASPEDLIATSCSFLFALQELADRRVFVVDVKNLVWPLLAAGLFGGCLGIGEREAWAGPPVSPLERRPIKPTVLHPELLRNFVANGVDARRAFGEYPCDCEAHEPDVPPTTRTDIRTHTLRVRLAMAEAATASNALGTVASWLTSAGWAAAELGLEPPRAAGYRAASSAGKRWRDTADGP